MVSSNFLIDSSEDVLSMTNCNVHKRLSTTSFIVATHENNFGSLNENFSATIVNFIPLLSIVSLSFPLHCCEEQQQLALYRKTTKYLTKKRYRLEIAFRRLSVAVQLRSRADYNNRITVVFPFGSR